LIKRRDTFENNGLGGVLGEGMRKNAVAKEMIELLIRNWDSVVGKVREWGSA